MMKNINKTGTSKHCRYRCYTFKTKWQINVRMKSEHMVDISVSSVERVQMIYIELVIPQVFSCDILEYKNTQVIKCVERDCAFKNKYQMTRHME